MLDWLTNLNSDFWDLIARLSWVAAVVGFPVAIWQLLVLVREQRRIAKELAKGPNMIIGFEQGANFTVNPPVLPTTCQVRTFWPTGQPLSDPVQLHIIALNTGERTAREPFINLTFPPGIEGAIGDKTKGTLHMEAVRDPAGNYRLIAEQSTLHPGVVLVMSARLQIPQGVRELPIVATVTLYDRPKANFDLRVTIT